MGVFSVIQSSNLQEGRYDPEEKAAYVRFKGNPTTYRYEDCPPDIWKSFESTFQSKENSSGKFFAEHIKPLKFTRVKE